MAIHHFSSDKLKDKICNIKNAYRTQIDVEIEKNIHGNYNIMHWEAIYMLINNNDC